MSAHFEKRKINLMPQAYLKSRQVGPDIFILTVIVIVFIYAGISSLSLKMYKKNLDQQLLSMHQLNSQLSKNMAQLQFDREKGQLNASYKKLVTGLSNQQYSWSSAFKEISHLIPSNTWLSRFDAETKQGKLEVLIEGEAASQYQMAHFFRSLERSLYYSHVSISFSEIMKDYNPELFRFQFKTGEIKSAGLLSKPTKKKIK